MYILFNNCQGIDIGLITDKNNEDGLIELEQYWYDEINKIRIPVKDLDLFIEYLKEVKRNNIFKP